MRKEFQKDCLDNNWLFLRKTFQGPFASRYCRLESSAQGVWGGGLADACPRSVAVSASVPRAKGCCSPGPAAAEAPGGVPGEPT